jgi:hypothetical protein
LDEVDSKNAERFSYFLAERSPLGCRKKIAKKDSRLCLLITNSPTVKAM